MGSSGARRGKMSHVYVRLLLACCLVPDLATVRTVALQVSHQMVQRGHTPVIESTVYHDKYGVRHGPKYGYGAEAYHQPPHYSSEPVHYSIHHPKPYPEKPDPYVAKPLPPPPPPPAYQPSGAHHVASTKGPAHVVPIEHAPGPIYSGGHGALAPYSAGPIYRGPTPAVVEYEPLPSPSHLVHQVVAAPVAVHAAHAAHGVHGVHSVAAPLHHAVHGIAHHAPAIHHKVAPVLHHKVAPVVHHKVAPVVHAAPVHHAVTPNAIHGAYDVILHKSYGAPVYAPEY